ncbi:hypothetical protein BD769DRAFT_1670519 [Suillus cothurnatus]|nr:hypothetical protein BD769DRAFT_1670519 [Suillus cothurnatus]
MEFVEHFFGLTHMLSPDFAYAELVKIVRHVMVHQQLLLTHTYKETREKDLFAGYILDVNTTPLSDDQFRRAKSTLNSLQLNQTVELAFHEAMLICCEILHIPTAQPHEGHHLHLAPLGISNTRLTTIQPGTSSHDDVGSNDDLTDMDLNSSDDSDSDLDLEPQDTLEAGCKFSDAVALTAQLTAHYLALCEDLETTISQSNSDDNPLLLAVTPQAHAVYSPRVMPSLYMPSRCKIDSHVLDSNGKVSITKMLETHQILQSGTTMKSERVVQMDPKFALNHVHESAKKIWNNEMEMNHEAMSIIERNQKEKFMASEASHRVQLHQSLHAASVSQKKMRELWWQVAVKALWKALPDVGM